LILYAPALCDMVGTSLMYIGLNLTYAASFQMFRGAVIIFTGVFSTLFLKRRLFCYKWTGILIVLAGLATVGCADIFFGDKKNSENLTPASIITGDLLIVGAQLVTAIQMVLEEKFVCGRNVPPLQAVGWEGLFGFVTLGVLLIPMYFLKISGAPIEDTIDGFYQIKNNWHIAAGFGGTILSISFFNFAGVSVTKEMSATTRMVLDSVRTIFIWMFSMTVHWQGFHPLTLIGFVVLLTGMMLYNNILFMPFLISRGLVRDPEDVNEDEREVLNEEE